MILGNNTTFLQVYGSRLRQGQARDYLASSMKCSKLNSHASRKCLRLLFQVIRLKPWYTARAYLSLGACSLQKEAHRSFLVQTKLTLKEMMLLMSSTTI